MNIATIVLACAATGVTLAAPAPAHAQSGRDCSRTSVGFTPLNDLGPGFYQGEQGGLYPGGLNSPPPVHRYAGTLLGRAVEPLDGAGNPSPAGRVVLLTIGMSNTRNESAQLIPAVAAFPNRHPALTVVNGAQGGVDAEDMSDPLSPYWAGVNNKLAQAGVTPQQVRAIWLKQAVRNVMLPFPQDADLLRVYLGDIARIIKDRFPNARLCYVSSRIYGGYALGPLNPEPYAYQSGFAVKRLVADQIAGEPSLNFDPMAGPVLAPWLAWGAYTWADGLVPRSDGLIWECDDFNSDGIHPNTIGSAKVADLLVRAFAADPTSRPWFVACAPDLTDDGSLTVADFLAFLDAYAAADPLADFNADGTISVQDFLSFLAAYSAGGCP